MYTAGQLYLARYADHVSRAELRTLISFGFIVAIMCCIGWGIFKEMGD